MPKIAKKPARKPSPAMKKAAASMKRKAKKAA